MIEIKNLSFNEEDGFSNSIDLSVNNGEIYFLLCKNEKCLLILFEMIRGLKKIKKGKIFLDSVNITDEKKISASCVNRIMDIADFDTEITLLDFINFMSNCQKAFKNKVLETLLNFNLYGKKLKKKIKNVYPEDFKATYLAISLANDYQNIVIYDFVRGEEKAFELNFNRLLREKVKEGKAIFYLTQDLFYACQIADRVIFMKNGYLMPENPIPYEDLKEMDVMKLYNQYLS